MKHLIFNVNYQSLQRLDNFKPAAGSVDYLTAKFAFTADWNGTAKTAKCRKGDAVFSASINSEGVCVIPHEVLEQDTAKRNFGKQEFFISVEGVSGTKVITTDEAKIELNPSGAGNEQNAEAPTESIYAQYIADVTAATKANADTATEQAARATESAEDAASSAASLKNDYSNALKGKASGAVIRIDDVSPVEHSPVVKVHGKNLVNANNILRSTYVNVNYTEPQLKITKTNTYEVWANIYIGLGAYGRFVDKTLTLSLENLNDYGWSVLLVAVDSDNKLLYEIAGKSTTGNAMHFTTNIPFVNGAEQLAIRIVSGDNAIATGEEYILQNIQVEYGNTATEYTPYIEPSTATVTDSDGNSYTPNADGTVEGITSTMIKNGISTDTDGMTIDCEYNRDINKVIEDIYSQLAGG